jgi:tyrosine-protein kinase
MKQKNRNQPHLEINVYFQYACRRQNSLKMIRLLIDVNANLQARNNATGLVPLHEAAASGNLEAIKELLSCRVPHMPRSVFGELPIDLANEKGHTAVVDFLSKPILLCNALMKFTD